MKKTTIISTFCGVCLLFGVFFFLQSCNKEENYKNPEETKANVPSPIIVNEKDSGKKSNAYLISAIHGDEPEYQSLVDLELLLVENAPLSNSVVSNLINTDRITDDIVELGLVLASSISSGDLNNLSVKRPLLNQQSILLAHGAPDRSEFRIAFTSPRTIIFGSNIVRESKGGEECEDCSSTITADNSSQIVLTSGVVSNIAPKCNPRTAICGKAIYVQIIASDPGGRTSYRVICEQAEQVCINGKI